MIDLKLLENKENYETSGKSFFEFYKTCLKNRKENPQDADKLLDLYQERKRAVFETEKLKSYQNEMSEKIAQLKKEKKETKDLILEIQKTKDQVVEKNKKLVEIEEKLKEHHLKLPNFYEIDTPLGGEEKDNKKIKTWGKEKKYSFKLKDHVQLGEDLDILDFKKASQISGARFCVLKNLGAKLERALISFMLDEHLKNSYSEILAPYLVNEKSLLGTGQLPKFKKDLFQTESFFLIPTGEVPLTAYFSNEILKEEDLPQNLVGFTPCFRSEAGSHGKDTKGLIRQHQFHKVELVKIIHPDNAKKEHEKLLCDAESILQKLNLSYRVVQLCSGDLGFSARKCYDLEVYLASQNTYREISSCSYFGDFQARRLNIRFKNKKSKTCFAHTLNGSGLAVGRTLVAILENYQNEDGSIQIPEALVPYMGGLKVLK